MGELKSWQEHKKVRFLFIRQISVLTCLVISWREEQLHGSARGEGLRRGADDGE